MRLNFVDFAFVSFIFFLDRHGILFYVKEKKSIFFDNSLGLQGLLTYFMVALNKISIFLDF